MNTSPGRMNLVLQFLAMVLFASYLASCRAPFRQNFLGSAQQCGLAPGQVSEEEIVIQLLNPEGQPLTRDQVRSLSSRMMLTDGQTQDLNVTPGGCLRLPSDQGTLQVYHAHAGWSYAGILQKPRFQQVRMVKNSSIQAFLQCPTQGFFSDEKLAFPLLWNSTGSLDAAQFQLIAEDLSNKKRYELYKKPYGETPDENPGFLATGDLPEGVYDLRFRFLLAQSAWDQAPVLPVEHERCRLTILHGPVHVTGLEDYPLHHGVGIFEQGSIIPLKSSRTEGQLRVCKEKREWDRATDESGAVDCQPRLQCLDPENFQPTAQVLADEVGIFDYFSEVRMPSGQVSSPRLCQTVLVSSSRPRLQVSWDNPRWGEELAVMDKPVSELSLHISRILNEQPRVLDDKLEGRLQCKAEFVYANQTIRPGRVFTCNEGACRGQSLETFKNCSEELKINILPIWSSLTSDGGHVRIHVRYDSGRNHIEEQSVAIGIKPRKWQPRELKTGDENFESGVALFKNRAGQIFSLSTTKGVLQWDETKFGVTDLKRPGSWQRMPPIRSGQKQDAATHIWLDRDGQLVVLETYEVAGSPSLLTVIARWTADGWKELAWPVDLKDPQCQQAQPGKRTGFWCRGTGPELIIERGDRLVALPLPDHAEIAVCLSSNSLHISENFQGNFAVACGSAVWQEQAGLWSKLELPQDQALRTMGYDRDDKLWLVQGEAFQTLRLRRWDGHVWEDLPNPVSWPSSKVQHDALLFTRSGHIFFGTWKWDESTRAWTREPALAHYGAEPLSPFETESGDILWKGTDAYIYLEGGKALHWNFPMLGLSADTGRPPSVFREGDRIWFLARGQEYKTQPYRITLGPWLFIPPPGQAFANQISNIWIKDLLRPQVYIPNLGLYQLDSDTGLLTLEAQGWNLIVPSPKVDESGAVETDIFQPYILAPSGIFTPTLAGSWKMLASFGEEYFFGGAMAAGGDIWVYNGNRPETGVIAEGQFKRQTLEPEYGGSVAGIYRMADAIWVATDLGLLRMGADHRMQEFVSWHSMGVRDFDRIRKVDDSTFLISSYDRDLGEPKAMWILDLNARRLHEWKLPPQAMRLSVGDIKRTSRGEFIMGIGFEIFIGDGSHWRYLFTRSQLYDIPGTSGFISYGGFELDAYDRLWINLRQGMLMIDTRSGNF